MNRLFCVMGKSASGKDTVFKSLAEDKALSLQRVVPYTTRPRRALEREGVEYHFVSNEIFEEMQSRGRVIESRSYNTVHGVWTYFTADDGQIDFTCGNYIVIGTLEAYVQIRNYFGGERVVPVYVEVEDGLRLTRALEREKAQEQPRYAEMCRRFLADCEDFSEEKINACSIRQRFENNDFAHCMEQIRQMIKNL